MAFAIPKSMWNVSRRPNRAKSPGFLFLFVLLASCQSLQSGVSGVGESATGQLYRWSRELDLIEADAPSDLVKGIDAENGLRFSLPPEQSLAFVETNLDSPSSRLRRIAEALVKVNARKVNQRLYLQIVPRGEGSDAVALEVDAANPKALLSVIASFMKRRKLQGKLSDSYQMNEKQAGAGVAYRLNERGKLETVSYDRYLATPWAEERDISEDFFQAKRPRRN